MPTVLTTKANERGSYLITVTFKDHNNVSVTPNAGLTWTLTDANGTVVNSRSAVAVSSAATVKILLTGLDLAVGDGLLGTERHLLLEGTYNSDEGNNLPLKEQINFTINNLTKLTGIV